jgi:hypothetical protein
MIKKTAQFISVLFHPLWVPLIGLYFLFKFPIFINYRLNEEYLYFIYIIFILNLVLAPLFISLYLKRQKIIKSLEMNEVKERSIPYLVSILFYIFTHFLLSKISFPSFYLSLFKAATITILLLFIFSLLKMKFSAHLAALGGFLGMLFLVNLYFKMDTNLLIGFTLIITGLVASARLALNAHGFKELFFGFLIGLLSQLSLIIIPL